MRVVGTCAYSDRSVSIQPTPELHPQAASPTLEIVWQDDATAIVLTRDADGALSAGELRAGMSAIADLPLAGRGIAARRLDPAQLVALADAPPAGLELGASAQAIFAVVELAQRSVAEGLVHPFLDHGDGWWHAFWGATLDEGVQSALTAIAASLPSVGAGAFAGDREATVHDLYPVLVDQIARDRLRADRVQLAPAKAGRANAIDHLLEGLTAPDSALPRHSGLAALERRLSDWVDGGLAHRARTTLDARAAPGRAGGRRPRARALAPGRGRSDARAAGVTLVGAAGRRLRLPPRRRSAPRPDRAAQ